jgi:superfamily I DNA/RNA helicase
MDDFFKRTDLGAGNAVLCRLTKPLVSLAFQCIRKKIACKVEGRDIAANLKKTILRWKIDSLEDLEDRLADYLEKETTKLLAKKQETKLQVIEDTVETIRIIIEECRKEKKYTVAEAADYVDQLFDDNVKGILVLSTIHKAKGREWPRVYWLDRANTCPSRWARQNWQQEQEVNLCYVAATRAQSELIELLKPAKPQ